MRGTEAPTVTRPYQQTVLEWPPKPIPESETTGDYLSANARQKRKVALLAEALMLLGDEAHDKQSNAPSRRRNAEVAEYDIPAPAGVLSVLELSAKFNLQKRPISVRAAFQELLDHGQLSENEQTGKYYVYRDGKKIAAKRSLRLGLQDQAIVAALLTARGEIIPNGVSLTTSYAEIRADTLSGKGIKPKVYAKYSTDGRINYGSITDRNKYNGWKRRMSNQLPGFKEWLYHFETMPESYLLTPYDATDSLEFISQTSPLEYYIRRPTYNREHGKVPFF